MIRLIRRLWFEIFPTYRRLEFRTVSWAEASRIFDENIDKPQHLRWTIANEEDNNRVPGVVHLERVERVIE